MKVTLKRQRDLHEITRDIYAVEARLTHFRELVTGGAMVAELANRDAPAEINSAGRSLRGLAEELHGLVYGKA